MTLFSTDIEEDTESLIRAGATILGRHEEAWGKLTVFEDSEGNVLKLMTPA